MRTSYPTQGPTTPLESLPEALRTIPRWMGARFERRKDGRVDKPPYCVRPGKPIIKADKTDPENWATYSEALAACERGDVDAIGLVFTEDDPFFVVDLDGVVALDTGEIHPAASEVIHALGCYTELSCSGTGAHIIGEGRKPEWAGCKSKKMGPTVEVYDSKRFVVMTGERIGDQGEPLERQEKLEWLSQRLWPKSEKLYSKRPAHPAPVGLEDQELLEKARRARSGVKFRKLYDAGDTSEYASASEADFALLNMLIFWTAGDPDRICRLFAASALHREREKHRSYVERSATKALANYVGPFYSPRAVKESREQEERDPLTPYLELLLDPSVWVGKRAASAFKTYVGLVWLASEHGIFDDEGRLRIGCDMRRLAEAACTRRATIQNSGLPELFKMGLLRSKRPKGRSSSVFILPNPQPNISRTNKIATHFIGTGYVKPQNALETLRLLARMRSGKDKHAAIDRLGMPAMFVAIALLSGPPLRGYSVEELADVTGRRKYDLRDAKDRPGILCKLKAAGIIREVSGGLYRLTDRFREAYERHLEYSGITHTERTQRRQHEEDRWRRAQKLAEDKQPIPLRGRDQVRRIMERNRKEAGDQGTEERLTDEQRIRIYIAQGMKPSWARAEVLGKGVLGRGASP